MLCKYQPSKRPLKRQKEEFMNNLNNVMNNVMAALNTFGIEYDVNVVSTISISWKKEELLESEQEILNYEESATFKNSFKSFAERPHFSRISGEGWADDGNCVIIQFVRTYQMDQKDWDDYAHMCGCSDPFEAQALYGDPNVKHIFLNVLVPKGKIHSFILSYAHFCWTTA